MRAEFCNVQHPGLTKTGRSHATSCFHPESSVAFRAPVHLIDHRVTLMTQTTVLDYFRSHTTTAVDRNVL
jgi:hypothetical protein